MQTTTTMIQSHFDPNSSLNGLVKMLNHLPQNFLQHSINHPLANLTYSHKNLSRSSFSLDHKSELEGLSKLLRTNDGKGHSAAKVGENSVKNNSSSIRMPTPVKPAYPKTIKEVKMPQVKTVPNERRTDHYQNVSKQDFIFDQKFAGSNQSNLNLFAESLISSQPENLLFAPNYQNFEKNSWNMMNQNLLGGYDFFNALNLRSLETTFANLDQEFRGIMMAHQKLQSKIMGKPNIVDKNVIANNFQKINPSKPFFIENAKTTKLNSTQSPITNVSTISAKNTPHKESFDSLSDSSLTIEKELSPQQEDTYSATNSQSKKRGSNKKPVQILAPSKEPSSQRRPVNRWQAMKAVEDQLKVEAEKPYVIDIHYNPEDPEQKVKLTSVGDNYQVDISGFGFSQDSTTKRTVKMAWNPENINQEEFDKFLNEIFVFIDEKSLNQEKVLKVLVKSNMNIAEAINEIKKDALFYKTSLRQDQRLLRNHGNTKAPFYGA